MQYKILFDSSISLQCERHRRCWFTVPPGVVHMRDVKKGIAVRFVHQMHQRNLAIKGETAVVEDTDSIFDVPDGALLFILHDRHIAGCSETDAELKSVKAGKRSLGVKGDVCAKHRKVSSTSMSDQCSGAKNTEIKYVKVNKSCSDAQEEMPGALPLTATSQRSPLWKKGETIYVDVATWYRPGTCPFPRNEKWLVEGKILKICDKYKRFTLSFPVFDEQHDMTLFYMKNTTHRHLEPGSHLVREGDDQRFLNMFLVKEREELRRMKR